MGVRRRGSSASQPLISFLLAPSFDFTSCRQSIPNFYRVQSALRMLFLYSGMSADEAVTFSCHSWRHLFPTAGRQFGMDDSMNGEMGQWEVGSAMPPLMIRPVVFPNSLAKLQYGMHSQVVGVLLRRVVYLFLALLLPRHQGNCHHSQPQLSPSSSA